MTAQPIPSDAEPALLAVPGSPLKVGPTAHAIMTQPRRHGRELCAGPDAERSEDPPPRKLSADEVERMCGRPLRVIG